LPDLFGEFGQVFVQPRLVIVDVSVGVQHAVGLDENNPLTLTIHNPQNEVRVKPALLEETYAPAAAQVAQEKDFLAFQ
jgi:hypothetical protein